MKSLKVIYVSQSLALQWGCMSMELKQSWGRTNTMADRAKLVAHAIQHILGGKAKYSCDLEPSK